MSDLRHLDNPDSYSIVERLERYDLAESSFSYAILDAPFPVVDYLATITVSPKNDGKGSHVEWSGTFTPKGISEEEAHNLFQGIFSNGLRALADRYASRK